MKKKTKSGLIGKIQRFPGIILGLTLIGIAAYALGWSSLLAVKSVSFVNGGADSNLIQSAIEPRDVKIAQPMARVDTNKIRRDIQKFSWIASVNVQRNWLHGSIKVVLTRKNPVAQFRDSNGVLSYLDSKGEIFTLPSPPSSLPEITFFDSSVESHQLALALISQMPIDILSEMSSLTILSPGTSEMQVSTPDHAQLTLLWGDATEIPLKVNVLRHLLTLKENANIKSVDLSVPLAPIVH